MGKNISNPFSTGGGGSDFEKQVGAYYLSCLLLKVLPKGFSAGNVKEVCFQQQYQGDFLDDIVIVSEIETGELKLSLQIKRDLIFGEKDGKFDEVISACWETFSSNDFRLGFHRFGICLGLYSKNIDEYYQTVLSWARNSSTAEDFFKRVSIKHLSNEKQRNFVTLIRNKLDHFQSTKISDNDLWNFLKSFVILRFDFHNPNSSDYIHILDFLRTITKEKENQDVHSLFSFLTDISAELYRTAGSINEEILRLRLETEKNFIFHTPTNFSKDLEILNEHADLIVNNIREDINGLQLNRISIIEEVYKQLQEYDCLELIGAPGSGKSAILKSLIQNQRGEGHSLVLSGDRIEGNGWNSFSSRLQLRNSLSKLLLVLGNCTQPIIFIDSPDRLTDSGSIQVIKDILSFLKQFQKDSKEQKKWKIILTSREENLNDLHSWFDCSFIGKTNIFNIPQLSDEELKLTAEYFPRISPLTSDEKVSTILRNPLMLNLLVDKRILPAENFNMPPIATEIEVQNIWWNRIVGSDTNDGRTGTIIGGKRKQTLLQIGDHVIKRPGTPFSLNTIDAEVLLSLEKDQIITHEYNQDLYRFRHDLFEDWVLSRVLAQHSDSLADYIKTLNQPLGLIRPMQLHGCSILEDNDPIRKWKFLVDQFEDNEFVPRWKQALYSSLLVSARILNLDETETILFNEDGKLLQKLLVLLRTIEINPNFNLADEIKKNNPEINDLPSIPYIFSTPRLKTWIPFLKWLLTRTDKISFSVRDEVSIIFEIWQQRTPNLSVFRREIGEVAFLWLSETEVNHKYYDRREREVYKERLRRIIFHSSDVLPERVREYIREIRTRGSWNSTKQILLEYLPLVNNLTSEFVDFFLSSLIVEKTNDPDDTSNTLERLGISDHLEFFPPSATQGPFFYLLNYNEDEGLRLINTLTNHAVKNWRERQILWSGAKKLTLLPYKVYLPTGLGEFWGDINVYNWARNHNAPDSIASALMALEKWLKQQIENGRNPEELFNKILSGSECVAIVCACIAAAITYPELCLKATLPLISQPVFWRMDVARVTLDASNYQQPEQVRHLRNLAFNYLFGNDKDLRNSFIQNATQFSTNLPFFSEEEKLNPTNVDSLRNEIEIYLVYTDPKNYRFGNTPEGQTFYWIEEPQHVKESQAGIREYLDFTSKCMSLYNWSSTSLKNNSSQVSLNFDQAFSLAKELSQPLDFREQIDSSKTEDLRLVGIVGTASVILLLGDNWLNQKADGGKEIIGWCQEIILLASNLNIVYEFDSRTSTLPFDPKAAAVLALGSLFLKTQNYEIKKQIIRLIGDNYVQIVVNVFRGFTNEFWNSEPDFCWNSLAMAIESSFRLKPHEKISIRYLEEDSYTKLMARERNRIDNLIQLHLENLEKNKKADLPLIPLPEEINFLWDLIGPLIQVLPLEELCKKPESKNKLFFLLNNLFNWTVKTNSAPKSRGYYEWDNHFFKWEAKLSKYLTLVETQEYILVPLKNNYSLITRQVADFLKNYIFKRFYEENISNDAILCWKEICRWVLGSHDKVFENRPIKIDDAENLTTIVFVINGECFFEKNWGHINKFTDLIDEWVQIVGHYPQQFSNLLIMLKVLWEGLESQKILQWLWQIFQSSRNVHELWSSNNNGQRTAELLQHIFHQNDLNLKDSNQIQQFSMIVDSLVIFGIPIASDLQKMLDKNQ